MCKTYPFYRHDSISLLNNLPTASSDNETLIHKALDESHFATSRDHFHIGTCTNLQENKMHILINISYWTWDHDELH